MGSYWGGSSLWILQGVWVGGRPDAWTMLGFGASLEEEKKKNKKKKKREGRERGREGGRERERERE